MSTKNATPTILTAFVLLTLTLLTGCQDADHEMVALAAPGSEVDFQAVENAMVSRWQAMAHFYAGHPNASMYLTSFNQDDVLAYRWQALARFYAEHPLAAVNLTAMNADDISAYRWQATARFYEENPNAGRDLRTLSPDEIVAFRWLAIAQAYEKSALKSPK
jgi:hypothetical protein